MINSLLVRAEERTKDGWRLRIENGSGEIIRVFTQGTNKHMKFSQTFPSAHARPRKYGPTLLERNPEGDMVISCECGYAKTVANRRTGIYTAGQHAKKKHGYDGRNHREDSDTDSSDDVGGGLAASS